MNIERLNYQYLNSSFYKIFEDGENVCLIEFTKNHKVWITINDIFKNRKIFKIHIHYGSPVWDKKHKIIKEKYKKVVEKLIKLHIFS